MAAKKPSMGEAFEKLETANPPSPPPIQQMPTAARSGRPKRNEETTLVGGQLAIRFGRSLNMLSAETGKANRELLEEALDDLFVKYGARTINA
ncbi:hypothetical protein HW571_27680 [Agrobacterium genomosp. 3]|uniref:ribbon-helix-helix domain-containing protein n=1 Tax=Agrobacterium tomkonis TaxID=1183410 RepID=UPI001CD8B1CD|nr:hypothetical protein [Agrobacterium tomkonis]MCA1879730.1 hypothetical protein [Agrobacterium tumefaciens]MCA1894976.1 hypothetical protein [Agrobacterium tomkonis]